MQKNNSTDKSSNPIATVLATVGSIILLFIGYCWWVNSHFFEGNFLGIAIQLPLESREHYCNRKADFGLAFDSGTYYNCLREGDSLHARLVRKMNSDANYTTDAAFKKYGISKEKYIDCMATVTEKYYSSSEIEEYLKTGVKMKMKSDMSAESYSNEIQKCYYK